jgi:hypothetical protein
LVGGAEERCALFVGEVEVAFWQRLQAAIGPDLARVELDAAVHPFASKLL